MNPSSSIIGRSYEAYKTIVQINDGLTKRWRYSLGLSLENSALDFMENLVMAKKAPKSMKGGCLIRADSQLEIITLKLRLLLDLEWANKTKIFQLQAKLEEIGRMLGGWLKATYST